MSGDLAKNILYSQNGTDIAFDGTELRIETGSSVTIFVNGVEMVAKPPEDAEQQAANNSLVKRIKKPDKVGYVTKASEEFPVRMQLLNIRKDKDGNKKYRYTSCESIVTKGSGHKGEDKLKELNQNKGFTDIFGKAHLPYAKDGPKGAETGMDELGMFSQNLEKLNIEVDEILGEARDNYNAYHLNCRLGTQYSCDKRYKAHVFPVCELDHPVI